MSAIKTPSQTAPWLILENSGHSFPHPYQNFAAVVLNQMQGVIRSPSPNGPMPFFNQMFKPLRDLAVSASLMAILDLTGSRVFLLANDPFSAGHFYGNDENVPEFLDPVVRMYQCLCSSLRPAEFERAVRLTTAYLKASIKAEVGNIPSPGLTQIGVTAHTKMASESPSKLHQMAKPTDLIHHMVVQVLIDKPVIRLKNTLSSICAWGSRVCSMMAVSSFSFKVRLPPRRTSSSHAATPRGSPSPAHIPCTSPLQHAVRLGMSGKPFRSCIDAGSSRTWAAGTDASCTVSNGNDSCSSPRNVPFDEGEMTASGSFDCKEGDDFRVEGIDAAARLMHGNMDISFPGSTRTPALGIWGKKCSTDGMSAFLLADKKTHCRLCLSSSMGWRASWT
ncbi:hypothetical protein MKZ38_006883 [Zalerion maritima]|uniref:Uncharacterized protein n=1 Tax=Zalerion maritima TaxID=339359 RepID=A0AAD5RN70_9PEZI|nr:hypothetical protein MKZ38_006883 [Zalerion maritima]